MHPLRVNCRPSAGRRGRRTVLAALVGGTLLAALLPGTVAAWGGFTHQRIALRALEELSDREPGAAALLADRKLLRAYLGGSMAPDMALNFLSREPDARLHRLLHRPEFADALIEASADDDVSLAAALGWLAHRVADEEGAHGPQGYANRKQTFTGPLAGRNHTAAEAMLDILSLGDKDAPRRSPAFDEDALAEAAARVGEDASRERFRKFGRRFRREVRVTETLFLAVAMRQRKGMLPSAGSFYADAEVGLEEGRGLARAAEACAKALEPHLVAFREEPLEIGWGMDLAIGQRGQNLVGRIGSGLARLPGMEKLSGAALEGLDRLGLVRRRPMVDFLRELLVTRESDFAAFVREFEASHQDE